MVIYLYLKKPQHGHWFLLFTVEIITYNGQTKPWHFSEEKIYKKKKKNQERILLYFKGQTPDRSDFALPQVDEKEVMRSR